jgi:UPF0271 protein
VGELYVDLDYNSEGGLIILRQPHATDPQQAAEKARRAIDDGVIVSVDGTELPIEFGSICVHSDTPNAVEVTAAVRAVVDR